MEIKSSQIIFLIFILTISCSSSNKIKNVYVSDFNSDDIKNCRASDVDLDHTEAKFFFIRAKKATYKIIHDHYNLAPCYIEGTLNKNSSVCEWEIRAGATGHIKCDEKIQYFVCDECDDLFK